MRILIDTLYWFQSDTVLLMLGEAVLMFWFLIVCVVQAARETDEDAQKEGFARGYATALFDQLDEAREKAHYLPPSPRALPPGR